MKVIETPGGGARKVELQRAVKGEKGGCGGGDSA